MGQRFGGLALALIRVNAMTHTGCSLWWRVRAIGTETRRLCGLLIVSMAVGCDRLAASERDGTDRQRSSAPAIPSHQPVARRSGPPFILAGGVGSAPSRAVTALVSAATSPSILWD